MEGAARAQPDLGGAGPEEPGPQGGSWGERRHCARGRQPLFRFLLLNPGGCEVNVGRDWGHTRLRRGLGVSHFPGSPSHRLVHAQGGQHSSPRAGKENEAEPRSAKWACLFGGGGWGGSRPLFLGCRGTAARWRPPQAPPFGSPSSHTHHSPPPGLLPQKAGAEPELWPGSLWAVGDTWR